VSSTAAPELMSRDAVLEALAELADSAREGYSVLVPGDFPAQAARVVALDEAFAVLAALASWPAAQDGQTPAQRAREAAARFRATTPDPLSPAQPAASDQGAQRPTEGSRAAQPPG